MRLMLYWIVFTILQMCHHIERIQLEHRLLDNLLSLSLKHIHNRCHQGRSFMHASLSSHETHIFQIYGHLVHEKMFPIF